MVDGAESVPLPNRLNSITRNCSNPFILIKKSEVVS